MRDLIAPGRENEIEEIRRYISTIIPDAPSNSAAVKRLDAGTAGPGEEDS